MAVASAGPYASLHLAPDRYHATTSLQFFYRPTSIAVVVVIIVTTRAISISGSSSSGSTAGRLLSTTTTRLTYTHTTHNNQPTAGRSGRVVSASDCGVREPTFEPQRGRLCLSRRPLRYTALGTGCAPLLQCLGRLSLPSSVGQ